jgi:hypothetical protein
MPSSPGSSSSPSQKSSPPPAPDLTADKKQGAWDKDNYARLGPAEVRTRQIVRAVILVVSLVGMALAVFFYARNYERYPHTDNAYVQADVVRIASRVSGPVVQMPLHDNQRVKQGDLHPDRPRGFPGPGGPGQGCPRAGAVERCGE